MIYKRLYNGNVVLRSLCGSPPHLLDPATAATAVAHQLNQGSLPPSRLWDIAHLLKQHAQCTLEASAAVAAQAAASASSPAAPTPVGGTGVQTIDQAAQENGPFAGATAVQLDPESTDAAAVAAGATAGGKLECSCQMC